MADDPIESLASQLRDVYHCDTKLEGTPWEKATSAQQRAWRRVAAHVIDITREQHGTN